MRNCVKDGIIVALLCFLIPAFSTAQIQKIYFLPKSNTTANQSTFIDSIRFIPIQIQEGTALDPNANIQISDKYFLLIDYSAKFVLVYSKDGHFIRKIIYKQLGEGFYPSFFETTNKIVFFGNNRNYALTQRDRVQVRLDSDNPRNKKYFKKFVIDLNDTTFSIQKVEPDVNDIIQTSPIFNDYYWRGNINTSPLYKDSLEYELKIFKNNLPVKKYFPYNRINEPRYLFTEEYVVYNRTNDPQIQTVTRPYCDTIYRMTKDSMVPVYQLVMPMENSLPPTFFTKPFKNKVERENFQRNNGWMFHQINNFYETPSVIFFSVRYNNNYESYIYKKQGNITYKTRSIKPDSSQYNLKLLDAYNLQRRGDLYFKLQKAGDIVQFFTDNKNVAVPKELVEFIDSKPDPATPLIVEYKLKRTP